MMHLHHFSLIMVADGPPFVPELERGVASKRWKAIPIGDPEAESWNG